jgi:hypothetical protein
MKYIANIVFCFFFNIFLLWFFPYEESGSIGMALISFPILFIACIVLNAYEHFALSEVESDKVTIYYRLFGFSVIILLSYFLFPSGGKIYDSPLKVIKQSVYLLGHSDQIKYDDLFLKKYNSDDFGRIVCARKKYKGNLPDKIFYVNCGYKLDSTACDWKDTLLAIYTRHGKIFSTNSNLSIEKYSDDSVKYCLHFNPKNDITFYGTINGLVNSTGRLQAGSELS